MDPELQQLVKTFVEGNIQFRNTHLNFYAGMTVPMASREPAHEGGLFILSRCGESMQQDTKEMRAL